MFAGWFHDVFLKDFSEVGCTPADTVFMSFFDLHKIYRSKEWIQILYHGSNLMLLHNVINLRS